MCQGILIPRFRIVSKLTWIYTSTKKLLYDIQHVCEDVCIYMWMPDKNSILMFWAFFLQKDKNINFDAWVGLNVILNINI